MVWLYRSSIPGGGWYFTRSNCFYLPTLCLEGGEGDQHHVAGILYMFWHCSKFIRLYPQDSLTAGQVKRLHAVGANATLFNAKTQVYNNFRNMSNLIFSFSRQQWKSPEKFQNKPNMSICFFKNSFRIYRYFISVVVNSVIPVCLLTLSSPDTIIYSKFLHVSTT
jgi:hypothetical protein